MVELMQEELEDRNREISHLSGLCEGSRPAAGEEHLRNTLKHLKGQLVRYRSIASNLTQKMLAADQTIQSYQEATHRCDLELRSLDGLAQTNKTLKQQCAELTKQVEAGRVEAERGREERLGQLRNLKVVMEENQCLHQFLFENYGESAQQLVEQARSAIVPRIEERTRREQWASIDELIEVNSRLKARCKVA